MWFHLFKALNCCLRADFLAEAVLRYLDFLISAYNFGKSYASKSHVLGRDMVQNDDSTTANPPGNTSFRKGYASK
jgi:hypothetical protein